jgi:uncharacterized membrane protein
MFSSRALDVEVDELAALVACLAVLRQLLADQAGDDSERHAHDDGEQQQDQDDGNGTRHERHPNRALRQGATVGAYRALVTQTKASTSRIEAFSDGVFAIAITLLVLEVKVPDVERGASLAHELLRLWPSYVAYAVSFLTIGIMWVNHHAAFERVGATDRGLLFRNLFLLGSVSFLPFPTAVLARYLRDGGHNARTAAVLYGITMMVIGSGFTALWHHLRRHPELLVPEATPAGVHRAFVRSAVGPFIYLVATGVAAIAPVGALAIFGAVAAYFALTRHRG